MQLLRRAPQWRMWNALSSFMVFALISWNLMAVAMLVKRHADGLLPTDDYNIELEDQRGQKLNMGSDRSKGNNDGSLLHTKGRS
ncbi:uncharacterized protein LOC110724326 isoform X3 [Chenopodium quinoa]|uniref:uncharacterized protein LOC110724326 isoform X3 n=1 Tax=Chenopodium quinoa TaxID=63459 RepID=UPI000B773D55|nr:uncharacterized protein LOC110724326 isoform X3 [Chenopodium quinoa]